MDLKAESDALMERHLRLLGAVHVDTLFALHELAVVIEPGLDDTVPNGFGYDEFDVFGGIEHQFGGNVGQRDARVRKRYGSDGRLDHVVTKANDQSIRVIGLEKSLKKKIVITNFFINFNMLTSFKLVIVNFTSNS